MSRTKKAPIMVRGSTGNLDYLVFARDGNVALSIKVNALLPGDKMGVPNTVWFGARLRASDGTDALPQEDESNVVALKPKKDLPTAGASFPDIVWEKDSQTRSSTTVGVYLRGGFGSAEQAAPVIEDMKGGKLAMQMAEYLMGLTSGGVPILSIAELADQLQTVFYDGMVAHVEKGLEVQVKMAKELEGTIGTFGMQAAMLKKVYAETAKESAPVDDATDEDDTCPDCGASGCEGECCDD